jgi:predicted small lipoprotein YifL
MRLNSDGENTMRGAVWLAILALTCAACGLKGPLYLPDPNQPAQQQQKKQ